MKDRRPSGTDELPTGEAIVQNHAFIEEEYDLTHKGARVATPQAHCRRVVAQTRKNHYDPFDRAAYLLRKLITSHFFEDGNKRTAWMTTLEYLDRWQLEPAKTNREDVEPVLKAIRAFDVSELSEWLETGEIDESKFHP